MQATNSLGPSEWSAPSTFTTQAGAPAQPEPPELLDSSPIGLTVGWQAPADNGAPVADFQLECDDGGGGPFRRVFTGLASKHAIPGLEVRCRVPALPLSPCPP